MKASPPLSCFFTELDVTPTSKRDYAIALQHEMTNPKHIFGSLHCLHQCCRSNSLRFIFGELYVESMLHVCKKKSRNQYDVLD